MSVSPFPSIALIFSALLSVASAPAHADCYQIEARGETVYQATVPPFDISLDPVTGPSADLIASRQRGERMIISPHHCTTSVPESWHHHSLAAITRTDTPRTTSAWTPRKVAMDDTIHAGPITPARTGTAIPGSYRTPSAVRNNATHVGPRGGLYRYTASGKKRYLSQDR